RTNMKITTRADLPQAEQISLEIRKRLARERMHQAFAQVREQ
ncbi:2-C-methyl-D-erythritol 4-phosphate cytidylyltransferase, partial [Bifidobacterium bifidum]